MSRGCGRWPPRCRSTTRPRGGCRAPPSAPSFPPRRAPAAGLPNGPRVQSLLARLQVELSCELARTTLGRSQLHALGQGDVVVCGERRLALRTGRGGFRAREHALGLAIETEFEVGEG